MAKSVQFVVNGNKRTSSLMVIDLIGPTAKIVTRKSVGFIQNTALKRPENIEKTNGRDGKRPNKFQYAGGSYTRFAKRFFRLN